MEINTMRDATGCRIGVEPPPPQEDSEPAADLPESALPEDRADETPPVPEGFCVRDEASANWVLRKIVEARAYAERAEAWAEREKRRAHHDEQFFLRCYGLQLETWCRREVETRGGRRRSVNLPAGTLGFRRVEGGLVVEDESRVIAWARSGCPAAVAVTERLSKTALNAHVRETGEVPPGVRLEEPRDRFFVR